MLRLTKKTEYALLALRFMSRLVGGALVSSRAIATHYNIPEMLLAKVLQQLKRGGFVGATKGSGGGYVLARPLHEIALIDLLEVFGEHVQVVECLSDEHDACQQRAHCDIKAPLAVLNDAIMSPLRHMTVADLYAGRRAEPAEATRGQVFTIRP